MAYIIVFGNEKGGSGKSTTAMHVMTALLRAGKTVGAVDIDLRQQTLGRYITNRQAYLQAHDLPLPMPLFAPIPLPNPEITANDQEAILAFQEVILPLDTSCDYIIIDCAGAHSALAELAHAMADTLVTPLNDSFIDFDLLAKIDGTTGKVIGPSIYSEMVWRARRARAESGARPMEWVVLRNRMGAQNMHNKRKVGSALKDLARRIGFRIAPGISDRVIYREMFPMGLTLLDMRDVGGGRLSLSNVAARQEMRDLIKALDLPDLDINF